MPLVEKKLEDLLRKLDDALADGMTIAQLTEVARAVLKDWSAEAVCADKGAPRGEAVGSK